MFPFHTKIQPLSPPTLPFRCILFFFFLSSSSSYTTSSYLFFCLCLFLLVLKITWDLLHSRHMISYWTILGSLSNYFFFFCGSLFIYYLYKILTTFYQKYFFPVLWDSDPLFLKFTFQFHSFHFWRTRVSVNMRTSAKLVSRWLIAYHWLFEDKIG